MASADSDAYQYQCGPGLCVIINNMKFDTPGFNDLPSDVDEASLRSTFSSLGFDVRVYRNFKAAEMESIAKEYSKRKHTGAFFLIISSHGGFGDVVYGTDGGAVAVHDLEKYFHATNCPSLAGIPKVFVIDTDRGNEQDFTPRAKYQSNTSSVTDSAYSTIEKASHTTRPQSASDTSTTAVFDSVDIMTIFASTRGKIDCCSTDGTSVFIQSFVKVINECSADVSLTDIMKKVHRKMQPMALQISEIVSTFSRNYYIKR